MAVYATITDMKLLFDARYIRTDFHDGISRYSAELARAVADQHSDTTFIICHADQLKFLPTDAASIMFHEPTSWREPFSALCLNRYQPDVVFSPMQTIGSFGRHFKLILTLHDMIYYRHRTPPKNLHWLIRAGWWIYHLTYWPQRLTLNSADIVATVSHTSEHDIKDAKLTKRPTVIIPNAPQTLAKLITSKRTTTTPTELVYMGSFMPYKNVETLIEGMAFLPGGYTLHLLSRIKPDRQAELERHISKGTNVVFHNGVSDTEYAELLARDALLVTASFDEGYGLPIAEALALGTPAVISDLAIFHEVAGKGALYFNPHDPQSFAKHIATASQHETYDVLIKHGKQHITKFTWPTSAKTLVDTACALVSQAK
ncbi:UDP-D-galactose:(glucosyl)lipopolysaccharide-1,6-D-galactosyltransferase [compost metagenome]